MENPAHVYTTGMPMSKKGNFSHNKYGCEVSETLDIACVDKTELRDYQSGSRIDLNDPAVENIEYINNSIQDGFQSDILCDLVCDTGLQTDNLPVGESVSMDIASPHDSSMQIKFTDSPGLSFSGKMCSSIESIVPCLDDQLDNFLLSDFKIANKSETDGVTQSLEEQQKTVNETLSAIAKSFGFEDLLPDTFQVDNSKDVMSITVSSDGLCDDRNDHIASLSFSDFEKYPSEFHVPECPLDLTSEAENYILNGLEMIISSPRNRVKECDINSVCSKLSVPTKENNRKNLNSKGDFDKNDYVVDIRSLNDQRDSETSDEQFVFSSDENNDTCQEIETEVLSNGIPTVSISDISINEKEPGDEHAPVGPATVVITRDKASRKMQIVLTLNQGQQIYDIDTEDVDSSVIQQMEVGFVSSVEKLIGANKEEAIIQPEEVVECDINTADAVQKEVESEESINEAVEDEETALSENNLLQFVQNMSAIKSKKGKTWVCPIEDCGHVLDKECKLRVHMISHKDARPFKCTFEGCDWAFTTPYRLRRHVETHFGNKDYLCDFEGCNRRFTTVYNLKTHKKRHKWPNSLLCPAKDCEMSFANRRKMELHLRVHKDVEAPYICSLCGKKYYSANCIASHYRTHQYNEDDFKCPFQGCGKKFDKTCRLKQHVRHHTGDRPYTCPAEGCKWSFMSASKLTRHMRKHTGERKFVCTEPGCGKSFMRPEHLKGHVVIHSGDKPFHCPHENCNARFTAKSSLYVHVKKHCPSGLKVVYACPVTPCVKKYNNKATLKQHIQKLHPELLEDGRQLDISEKLELTMPVSVSVSSGTENSLGFLELEESMADDPLSGLKAKIFFSKENPSNNNSQHLISTLSNSNSFDMTYVDTTHKLNKSTASSLKFFDKNSSNLSKSTSVPNEINLTSVILFQENQSGSARTDYCVNHIYDSKKNNEHNRNVSFLNHANESQDSRNYLSLNQSGIEIKSPDVMLASSIIFQDQSSEQFVKNHFITDDSETNNSLYQDDSMLVNSSAFGAELPLSVSLLSDADESNNSVITSDTSPVVFSSENAVTAFNESALSLQGLDC